MLPRLVVAAAVGFALVSGCHAKLLSGGLSSDADAAQHPASVQYLGWFAYSGVNVDVARAAAALMGGDVDNPTTDGGGPARDDSTRAALLSDESLPSFDVELASTAPHGALVIIALRDDEGRAVASPDAYYGMREEETIGDAQQKVAGGVTAGAAYQFSKGNCTQLAAALSQQMLAWPRETAEQAAERVAANGDLTLIPARRTPRAVTVVHEVASGSSRFTRAVVEPTTTFWHTFVCVDEAAVTAAQRNGGDGDDDDEGWEVLWEVSMVNAGGKFTRQFSANEQGEYELFVGVFAVLLVHSACALCLTCCSVYVGTPYLRPYAWLTLCLFCEVCALAMLVLHKILYATDGVGAPMAFAIGTSLHCAVVTGISLLCVALVDAWGISLKSTSARPTVLITLLFAIIALSYAALAASGEGWTVTSAPMWHLYASLPGFATLFFRLLVPIYFGIAYSSVQRDGRLLRRVRAHLEAAWPYVAVFYCTLPLGVVVGAAASDQYADVLVSAAELLSAVAALFLGGVVLHPNRLAIVYKPGRGRHKRRMRARMSFTVAAPRGSRLDRALTRTWTKTAALTRNMSRVASMVLHGGERPPPSAVAAPTAGNRGLANDTAATLPGAVVQRSWSKSTGSLTASDDSDTEHDVRHVTSGRHTQSFTLNAGGLFPERLAEPAAGSAPGMARVSSFRAASQAQYLDRTSSRARMGSGGAPRRGSVGAAGGRAGVCRECGAKTASALASRESICYDCAEEAAVLPPALHAPVHSPKAATSVPSSQVSGMALPMVGESAADAAASFRALTCATPGCARPTAIGSELCMNCGLSSAALAGSGLVVTRSGVDTSNSAAVDMDVFNTAADSKASPLGSSAATSARASGSLPRLRSRHSSTDAPPAPPAAVVKVTAAATSGSTGPGPAVDASSRRRHSVHSVNSFMLAMDRVKRVGASAGFASRRGVGAGGTAVAPESLAYSRRTPTTEAAASRTGHGALPAIGASRRVAGGAGEMRGGTGASTRLGASGRRALQF